MNREYTYNYTYMSAVAKKLTILVEPEIYHALQKRVGRGNIGRFLADAARPHLASDTLLRTGYAQMAADAAREREAQEWSEGLFDDAYAAKQK